MVSLQFRNDVYPLLFRYNNYQPNEQLFVTSDYTAPLLHVVAAMNPFWGPSIN